jgi:hypothetical protein
MSWILNSVVPHVFQYIIDQLGQALFRCSTLPFNKALKLHVREAGLSHPPIKNAQLNCQQ